MNVLKRVEDAELLGLSLGDHVLDGHLAFVGARARRNTG